MAPLKSDPTKERATLYVQAGVLADFKQRCQEIQVPKWMALTKALKLYLKHTDSMVNNAE